MKIIELSMIALKWLKLRLKKALTMKTKSNVILKLAESLIRSLTLNRLQRVMVLDGQMIINNPREVASKEQVIKSSVKLMKPVTRCKKFSSERLKFAKDNLVNISRCLKSKLNHRLEIQVQLKNKRLKRPG